MTQSNELGSADPGPATEQAAQQPEQHLCRERHTERASHDYVQNAAQWAHVAKLPSTEPSFIDIRRLDLKPMLETPTWYTCSLTQRTRIMPRTVGAIGDLLF